MTPRRFHSITATSLGPGLTEVLVFGGRWENHSTILRFGEQLLVHVAMATHCLIDKYTRVNDSECIYCYMSEEVDRSH